MLQNEQNLGQKFAALLMGGAYDYTAPRVGDVHQAVIMTRTDRDMIVDLGAKRAGVVPARDLTYVDQDYVDSLEVGDTIPVVVLRGGLTEQDTIRVSLNKGLEQKDWLRAQDLLETGEIIEAEVVDTNRGGVLVQFGGVRGFVPNSHLGSLPSLARHGQIQEAKEALIGQTLSLVIIEVNRRRRRLVLSKRAVDRRQRAHILESLEPGQTRTGIVRNLVDFGAFVDLGGIDGLVHISELAHEHVSHPSDVVSLGDEVEVYVLNIDTERQRIGLSRKRLLPDPWQEITQDLEVGAVSKGQVTNVVDFGLFVDLGKGVEGLVHHSEIPMALMPRFGAELTGSQVEVEVLSINHEKQQLGLRLRLIEGEDPASNEAEIEQADTPQQDIPEGLLLY